MVVVVVCVGYVVPCRKYHALLPLLLLPLQAADGSFELSEALAAALGAASLAHLQAALAGPAASAALSGPAAAPRCGVPPLGDGAGARGARGGLCVAPRLVAALRPALLAVAAAGCGGRLRRRLCGLPPARPLSSNARRARCLFVKVTQTLNFDILFCLHPGQPCTRRRNRDGLVSRIERGSCPFFTVCYVLCRASRV